MLIAILLGFLFGWFGSVPVAGPIAALVVTRGMEGRFRAGAYIALGGGLVEAAYAFLAFLGFSTFLTEYPLVIPISRGAAAVVLLVLGITFARPQPEQKQSDIPPRDSAFGSFLLGAWICAVNPTLIATWAAVVTTIYAIDVVDLQSSQALPFALGACVGIAGWFLTLLWLIRRYRERFSQKVLSRVIRGIGVALLVLAAWFAWRFVQFFLAS
ncbi:MAG: LysE family transporter [Deltaproteobacteria bacterium]|nr:LysE family transporter [Deltaproteobacteria bacterium]